MSRESFDQKYSSRKLYWGAKPSNLVKNFAALAKLGPALDLGMGEGRNSLFLAKQDYDVTGVDHSGKGVEKCRKRADKIGVNIDMVIDDIRSFKISKRKYSLILSNKLFQYITKSEAQSVSRNIIAGLKKDGIIIISVHTYDDPRYSEYKKKATELEPGSFLTVTGDICSLYDYRELLNLFEPLRLLHYSEYDYYHAYTSKDGHWHGVAELVAKKI